MSHSPHPHPTDRRTFFPTPYQKPNPGQNRARPAQRYLAPRVRATDAPELHHAETQRRRRRGKRRAEQGSGRHTSLGRRRRILPGPGRGHAVRNSGYARGGSRHPFRDEPRARGTRTSVSGSENAVLAPVDEELERAFGLTVVSRETTTYKSETRYAWRDGNVCD